MEKYTFERFEEELDNGYQMYYTYVRNRYLLFKYTIYLIIKYNQKNLNKIFLFLNMQINKKQ